MSLVLHENLMEPMEIIKEIERTILKNWADYYKNISVLGSSLSEHNEFQARGRTVVQKC